MFGKIAKEKIIIILKIKYLIVNYNMFISHIRTKYYLSSCYLTSL